MCRPCHRFARGGKPSSIPNDATIRQCGADFEAVKPSYAAGGGAKRRSKIDQAGDG
jgi:hypothetical protein